MKYVLIYTEMTMDDSVYLTNTEPIIEFYNDKKKALDKFNEWKKQAKEHFRFSEWFDKDEIETTTDSYNYNNYFCISGSNSYAKEVMQVAIKEVGN